MNREVFLLFKNNLIHQYQLNHFKKENWDKNFFFKVTLVVFLTLMFSGYSFSLAYGLGYMGLSNLIPAYAITATGIPALLFSTLKTNGFLFGYRDYDLLMSLPLPIDSVIASRFLAVYVTNLLFSLIIMAPMGCGYAIWTKPGILFYFYWLVGMITAPLVPTTIAVILGAFIMAFSSRFKYTKALSVFLTLFLLSSMLLFSMTGGTLRQNLNDTQNMIDLGNAVYDKICHFYPLAGLFSEIYEKNSFLRLVLFAGLSLFIYQGFLWCFSPYYKAINTALQGQIKKSGYQLSALSVASPLHTLYRKELKRFLSCSPYLINTSAGSLMALLYTLVLTIMGPIQLEDTLGMPGFASSIQKFLPALLSILLAMSCTTGSSLSLEGKNLWILQSAPLPAKTIFDSKILVNLTLTLPSAILCGTLLAFRFSMDPLHCLLLFGLPIISSVFSAVWGMFINIRMPRYDWESEMIPVKQSAASFLSILGGSLIILIALSLSFLPVDSGYHALSFLSIALIGIAAFFLYRVCCRTKAI